MPTALLVDDDVSTLEALRELVELEGFTATTATTLGEARTKANGGDPPDLLLVDLVLPDGSGLDLVKGVTGQGGETEVVLVTGHASIDTAIAALRTGVLDYLVKPIEVGRLKSVLADVAQTRERRAEIKTLRKDTDKHGQFGHLLGASRAMQKVYDLIVKAAPTSVTVLLIGESGTGKDLAAQTLHDLSRRRKGPFLPLNCSAISPALIESELFGHVRGSFTGAERTHKGYFERASGGTLFLDEITEMAPDLQAKLLRVLETSTMLRIGGDKDIPVDVRIVAATNRDPAEAVAEGKLREDLFYRLSAFPIEIPPLRARENDVEMLAQEFLRRLNEEQRTSKALTPAAIERLRVHPWPGNVRELKNVVHRAFIIGDAEIEPDCLPVRVPLPRESQGPALPCNVGDALAEVERRLIVSTLAHFGNDKRKTAEVLGISLRTLYNRLDQYRSPVTPSPASAASLATVDAP